MGDQTSQKTGAGNTWVFIEKSALCLPQGTLATVFLCMKCASSQWGENMLDTLLGNFVRFLEMLCGSLTKNKLSCEQNHMTSGKLHLAFPPLPFPALSSSAPSSFFSSPLFLSFLLLFTYSFLSSYFLLPLPFYFPLLFLPLSSSSSSFPYFFLRISDCVSQSIL